MAACAAPSALSHDRAHSPGARSEETDEATARHSAVGSARTTRVATRSGSAQAPKGSTSTWSTSGPRSASHPLTTLEAHGRPRRRTTSGRQPATGGSPKQGVGGRHGQRRGDPAPRPRVGQHRPPERRGQRRAPPPGRRPRPRPRSGPCRLAPADRPPGPGTRRRRSGRGHATDRRRPDRAAGPPPDRRAARGTPG